MISSIKKPIFIILQTGEFVKYLHSRKFSTLKRRKLNNAHYINNSASGDTPNFVGLLSVTPIMF